MNNTAAAGRQLCDLTLQRGALIVIGSASHDIEHSAPVTAAVTGMPTRA